MKSGRIVGWGGVTRCGILEGLVTWKNEREGA
jgi:hypothetical protein